MAQIDALAVSEEAIDQVTAILTADAAPPVDISRYTRRRNEAYEAHRRRQISGAELDTRLAAIDTEEREARAVTPPTITRAQVAAALKNLKRSWSTVSPRAQAELIAATYRGVPLRAGGQFGTIQLTPEAEATGITYALPEEVIVPVKGRLACPRGLEPPTFRSAT